MSSHARAELKASSLGLTLTTGPRGQASGSETAVKRFEACKLVPYLSCKILLSSGRRPFKSDTIPGNDDNAFRVGPGNLASGCRVRR